ncbi:MAG TPA: glycosyltransferase [Fibrobacteria bacterium]|nr:glycosyltransferase [Fibrobacteria bacterium]
MESDSSQVGNGSFPVAEGLDGHALTGIHPLRLYAGDLPPDDARYEGWIGLSLTQRDARHMRQDLRERIPLPDCSVDAFQAEDVLEHISMEAIPGILDEIHRILKPGGVFRLSVPDYRCDVLLDRSVKDATGKVVFDPGGGGTPSEPGHLWHPLMETLEDLIRRSRFHSQGKVEWLQGTRPDGVRLADPIDPSNGLVRRTPDHDPRVMHPRRPMSLVVDLRKDGKPEALRIATVLVAFNRPKHTAKVIDALRRDKVRDLFVLCDAPRGEEDRAAVEETRRLVGSIDWTRPKVVLQERNRGLARSILQGVGLALEDNDAVILLEDDCVPNTNFFPWMRACLETYRDVPKVFGISGYSVPIPEKILADHPYDAYFVPRMGSWGWATWKDRWKTDERDLGKLVAACLDRGIDLEQGGADIPDALGACLAGELKDTWTLPWLLNVYLNDGCYVYPTVSHIDNIGMDGTGIHCGRTDRFVTPLSQAPSNRLPAKPVENSRILEVFRSFYPAGPIRRFTAEALRTLARPKASFPATTPSRSLERSLAILRSAGKTGPENPKVVLVTAHDHGGAGKAALRLHRSLSAHGRGSRMLVLSKKSDDSQVRCLRPVAPSEVPARCLEHGDRQLIERAEARWAKIRAAHPRHSPLLEQFSEFETGIDLADYEDFREADIVHLHWAGGVIDYTKLARSCEGKKVVWTLHDMNAFTGGCHYDWGCGKHRTGCRACPLLGSQEQDDYCHRAFQAKLAAFRDIDLTITTPSRWLSELAASSILLGGRNILTIPNSVPLETFRPLPREQSRRLLGIPLDRQVVVFGCEGLSNPRKGLAILLRSIELLRSTMATPPLFCFFGASGAGLPLPADSISLGGIDDENRLARVFTAGDAFAIPSLQDNLPNIVLEAMACGTPVAGFRVGGIPDMVDHGRTGHLATEGSPEELAASMRWLLENSTPRMREQARRTVEERFSPKRQAEAFQELYERLGASSSPSTRTDSGSHAPSRSPAPRSRTEERGGHGSMLTAIVSVYKAERFLRGCLDDLMDQSLWKAGRLEIIVVDTGSPESESGIVRQYQARFGSDRIRLIRTEDRRSIYAAWNLGIQAARGTYLTNANADDRHHPQGLERLVEALETHPGSGLAYADSLCTRTENETWTSHTAHARFWWPDFDAQLLFEGNFIGPHPVWKRALHDRCGLFQEDLRIAGDYEFWLRLVSAGVGFLHVPSALGLYLEGGAEATNLDLSKSETETVKMRHWKGPGNPPAELSRGYQAEREPMEAIWSNLCFGLPDRARRIARTSASEDPSVARLESRIDRIQELLASGDRDEALELVKASLLESKQPGRQARSTMDEALDAADRHLASGRIDLAVAELEPLAGEGALELLTALAWLETRRGNIAASLRWYRMATERHPLEIAAWSNLAGVLMGLGDSSGAQDALGRILAIDPNEPEALVALVRILGRAGMAKEAGDSARRFIAAHHAREEREEFLQALANNPGQPRGVPFPKDHCAGRIVALVSSFNEGDVIGPVLEGLIAEGIDVYLIDNASTDDTVLQASRLLGKGLIHIERFPHDAGYPSRSEKEYVWTDILRRKEELALHLGADWYLHADADEFRESPWEGLSLSEAIRKADSEGWNAINHELFNFRPTDDSFPRGEDPRRHLTGYEAGDWFDSVQIKTWKNPGVRVDLASSGGHSVGIPRRLVCPIPFILRHYPIRGESHGRRKVMAERLGRFSPEEKARGWHVQYDEFKDGRKRFLFDADRLCPWGDGTKARRAIMERFEADQEQVGRCKGTIGSMELDWTAFALQVDAKAETHLARDLKVLQEADTVLRGFADHPDTFRQQIESSAQTPLGAIWREVASIRSSQARLAGEIHLARGYRTILGWLEPAKSDMDLLEAIESAHATGDTPLERLLISKSLGNGVGESLFHRVLAARSRQDLEIPNASRVVLPEHPRVSVVIPVHNGADLTRNCLTSIFSTPSRHSAQIVVVDDASTDGTNAYLRGLRDSGRILLVEHAANLGFAASCNDGAHATTGDVLVFLNNDTIVQAGWLDALVDELVRDASVGIAGSRLLYPDGRIQHAGMVWEWQEGRPHPEHAFRRHPGDAPEVRICLDYPAVTGACMAIPSSLFTDLGGFSHEFGMYCEDVDLCLRVWDMGLRVRYVPASRLFHLESATPIDLQARAERSRKAADLLRASWKGRWPAAYAAMPSWMWPQEARTGVGPTPTRGPRIGFDARTLSVPDSVVRGIGNYALHHLQALLRSRPGTPITCLHDDTPPPAEIVERTKVLGAIWEPWSSRSASDFDLFHTPDPMHVYPGYASPFQRFGSTRVTATFHDIIPIRVYEGRIANWPAYLARLDEISDCGATLLCNSEFTRRDLLEATSIRPEKTLAVMAGFNASASGRRWSRKEGDALLSRLGIREPFFLHVGAADPHKNFESSLAACQALGRNRPVQFVVVGKLANALGSMRDQVRQANLKDVVFTDYLEREELELLYSRAVATLFLSRYEGFGFPALEAMASGCPVIASDAASIPEIVGDAAVSHKPDDLAAIVQSMVRLMDDPSLREDLIARGRERAGKFTWAEVARRTWEAWDRLLASSAPSPRPAPASAKVQWISPVWDPSGYADESRAFVRHLASTDLGVGLLSWGRHSESFRQAASPDDRRILDGAFGRELAQGRVVVLDIPASALGRVPGGGVHVGRTTFETDGLPADWVERCDSMDEIWVPCGFNRDTFARAGVAKPILVVGEGVDTDRFRPGLDPLPLPGNARSTTFLSIFEWTHRKGPDLLLEAWSKAFTASDDVRLVLRCYPPNQIEGDPAAWVEAKIDEELARVGSSRSRCAPILALARQVPDEDMPRLYAAADVYVAPSRGEGWGRPHMEAMSSGLAVVATRWSGNLEFQNDDNSWLIDIDGLEPIGEREEFPFYRGQRWASPSVGSLVSHLRRAVSDPDARKRVGRTARRDMVELWDWKRIAPLAELRIREILQGIPAERSVLAQTRSHAATPARSTTPPHAAVRWCGQMFNHSGYARLSREAVAALMDAGIPVTADPLNPDPSWFEGISPDDRSRWTELLRRDPVPGTLVCCDIPVDATGANELFEQMRQANPGCARRVGWTMFESDRLPDGWAPALNRLDEVWVPSEFNRRTFASGGVDASRIHVVPPGIDVERFASARAMDIHGPRRATTFLSVFQWSRRKGWDVLLKAWAKAFKPQADVRLVLRCHPFGNDRRPMGEIFRQSLAELGLTESDMAPVVLLEDFVAESDLPSLYAAADVFVLPTRGEGWCFPYLEAMAAGKPCIATAWGASVDFLDADCCWLASAGRTEEVDPRDLRENRYLAPGHRWADPDPEEIAGFLREAASDVPLRLRKSQNALRHAAKWSRHRTAQAIAARLSALKGSPAPSHPDLSRSIEATARGILQRSSDTRTPQPSQASASPERHPGRALEATAAGILERAGRARTGAVLPVPSQAPDAASQAPVPSLSIRWEGSQLVHHSLANVNREICLRLAKSGHDLSLIPFEPDQFSPDGDPDLSILATLRDAPLEGPCQVHVRHQWPPRLDAPAEGRWVVMQPWEFGSPPKDWLPVFRDRVDEIWCYTEYVKRVYLEAGVPEHKLAVVPLGVDVDRYRPGLEPLPELPRDFARTTFLFVGGTIARKGFDCLLDAWARAFTATDPVRLVVKGMGGGTFYKGQTGDAMVAELNASGKAAPVVLFDRELDPKDVPRIYACADILVHPYRGEGFGLPIAEAMACGLPCIATRGGSADDFCSEAEAWMVDAVRKPVPGGKVGPFETVSAPWWLEPDIPGLVRALREALSDPALRRSKGRAARERIVAGFTWDHAARRMERRLADLASRPAAPTASGVPKTKFVSALEKLSMRIRTGGGLEVHTPVLPGTGAVSDDISTLDRILVRAEAAAARRDFAEAEDLTRQAVEEHPHQHMAWLARAMILRGLGRFRKAVEAVDRSLALEETPDALLEALQIHLAAGEATGARKREKALKDRHAQWLKATREVFRARGQTWPLDSLKPQKAVSATRKGKR